MSATTDKSTGGNGWVGRAMRRKEDPRMITGEGTYTDDVTPHGTLYAAIVRSPEAHARIASIDTSAAKARDDVLAVFTGEDLTDIASPMPMIWAPPGVEMRTPERYPLARDKVFCVGDPVAIVIADDKYKAVDAAEHVVVEYEPLPVIMDPEKALEDGAPIIHEEFGTNESYQWSLGGGDLEAGFAAADRIVERRIVNHRTAGAAIEPRSMVAEWRGDALTLTSSTQVPFTVRSVLAGMLAISEERIRVIAPDVGGAFGSKLQVYAEEVLVCWCARKLGQAVKWTATRSDDMAAMHHGRDQIDYVRLGIKNDGTLTALHAHHAVHPRVQRLRDERVLQDPCGPDRHHRGVHEQVPHRRHPRRRAARGHAPDRDDDGPGRRGDRNGPARGSAEELHPQGGLPGRGRDRRRLRLRRL
jgi:carbon-monoxide dehydrogenase large subunit